MTTSNWEKQDIEEKVTHQKGYQKKLRQYMEFWMTNPQNLLKSDKQSLASIPHEIYGAKTQLLPESLPQGCIVVNSL